MTFLMKVSPILLWATLTDFSLPMKLEVLSLFIQVKLPCQNTSSHLDWPSMFAKIMPLTLLILLQEKPIELLPLWNNHSTISSERPTAWEALKDLSIRLTLSVNSLLLLLTSKTLHFFEGYLCYQQTFQIDEKGWTT